MILLSGEPGGTDGAHQAKGSRNEDKELKETKIFASVLTFLNNTKFRTTIGVFQEVKLGINSVPSAPWQN